MSRIIPTVAYLCQQQAEYVVTKINILSTYPQLIKPRLLSCNGVCEKKMCGTKEFKKFKI